MATCTYAGMSLFGPIPTVHYQDGDPAVQVAAYSGAEGVVTTYLGQRGSQVVVQGVWLCATAAEIDALRETLLSYKDGICRPLVTPSGYVYPYAQLRKLDLDPAPLRPSPRGWTKRFTATFFLPRR